MTRARFLPFLVLLTSSLARAACGSGGGDRISQWDGLSDHLLLYSPSIGMTGGRVQENLTAIAETFSSA